MPSLRVPISELNLKLTLPAGQSFRWKKRAARGTGDQNDVWVGVIGRHVVSLSQDESNDLLHYEILNNPSTSSVADKPPDNKKKKIKTCPEELIREYFQLEISLGDLYQDWKRRDSLIFSVIANKFPGVRVLRQDPVENLFSFICSSCNNIKRISSMIDKLCIKYGDFLMRDDELGDMHSFPAVATLADPDMDRGLRELGFGYRAAFIQKSADKICKDGISLQALRRLPYAAARSELMRLPGIGRKVADCICLFSLDQPSSIPVDTHVYQIAARHYLKHLPVSKKSAISEKTYNEVSSMMQEMFGSYAGWAHSVLFTADLTMFRDLKT